MVNGITTQAAVQAQVKPVEQTGEAQQAGMRPAYEYIARNNAINAGGSVVLGTAWGLTDAKNDLKDSSVKFKDLFKGDNLLKTLGNVGKKILILAGSIALADILFQKVFKTNKQYEEMYQEDLQSQKK
ncbi:MAG: hypothetical protein PHC34_07255 [Candidatus Gastranaerophilales bacterium]|nr:hypothetical protein [Candidatus Gastranaerophilales bacterium]